jgi:enterobactin synthetase component D
VDVRQHHGKFSRITPGAGVARWARLFRDIAFDLCLEHGRCLGVHLPEGEASPRGEGLPAEEQAFAATLTAVRRRTWLGGRVALRQALVRAGLDAPAVLADARGAPMFPPGGSGSISHKETLAVALVARADPSGATRLGVDIELDAQPAHDIASRVLTDDEVVEVAALEERSRAREVLLRFSAKEAIYKALDPFVRRYVAFKEVAVSPLPGGAATVELRLPASEGAFDAEVRWLRREGFVLTTARVIRR